MGLEIEDDQEVEVSGEVTCPCCGKKFVATIVDTVHVSIDYEPDGGDWYD